MNSLTHLRSVGALAIGASLVLGARVSRAQEIVASPALASGTTEASSSPSPAPAVEDPNALFGQAVEMLQEGRFSAGLALLQRVRAIRETPAVLYNIAVAERALDHPIEAVRALERYIAIAGDRLALSRRTDVDALVTELRSAIAMVTMNEQLPGVHVTLDGEIVDPERWNAPFAINPGRHVWVVTGDRVRPLEVARQIQPGERVIVELTPERVSDTTRLRVTTGVGEAEIMVNHLLVGQGTYDARVRPGRAQIDVRARGYYPYSSVVQIAPGQSSLVQVHLTRDVPITQRWWFWTIAGVVVAGAAVTVTAVATSGVAAPDPGSIGRVTQTLVAW